MTEPLTTDQHACVSCGAIGHHLQGCRFAPKEARTIEQKVCDAKRSKDGRLCGKPAKYRQVWDHPERFPQRHFCAQHARYERVEPL